MSNAPLSPRNRMAQVTETPAFDRRVWLLALAFFAIGTDFNVVSGILPALARSLDVSVPAAGQVVSAYAVFYAVCAPVLAGLTAHIPRKPLIVISLTAFALANAASALSPGYAFLIGTRIVAAFAASVFSPAAYGLAATLARPDRRGAALSAVLSGITISLVVGVPIGTYVGNRFGWPSTFWFVTALSLIGAAGLAMRLPHVDPPAAAQAPGFAARFAPLANREVLLGMAPSLVWYVAMFSLFTYLGAAMTERGMNKEGLSAIYGAFGVGCLLGNHVGGKLSDRLGSQRVIAIALVLQIANLVWLGLAGSSIVANACSVAIFGMNMWFLFPAQQSRLLSIAPQHGPLVLALNNSTIYLGGAIGSAASALLIRHGIATAHLPWVSCVLFLAALVLFALCAWALRRDALRDRRGMSA
jgi:MFS transporter, DHA1 family, inner membrane transport protein